MKVLIDVTSACKSARNSGIQRITRQLFAELATRVPVTPLCWNRLGNFYQRLDSREMEYLRTPFRRYNGPISRPHAREDLGEFLRLLRNGSVDMLNILQDDDVIFVPGTFTDRRMQKLPEMARRTRARFVAIFHDLADLRMALLSGRRMKKFQNYIELLATFDLVICVSNQSHADLFEFWKQNDVTAGVETFVEHWPLEFDQNERSAAHSARPVILCVSSLTARKNHIRLFDAARQLWDSGVKFDLQLIGSSTNNWGRRVALEAWRLQSLGRPIRWLKHVDDRTLHQAYRECLFTVYPSLIEGFGLPILESLWHGKPCVCGGNGALGEVARGGGCLIVDQTSENAIAAGIKKLLRDQATYARLREEARARKFGSWSDYIEKLLQHLSLLFLISAALLLFASDLICSSPARAYFSRKNPRPRLRVARAFPPPG